METKNLLTIPVAIIIAGVLIAVAVLYIGTGKNPAESQTAAVTQAAPASREITIRPVSSNNHILGNPSAPVVLIEFSDTECPFCKSFHPTLHQLMDKYGKAGELAWVYRQFPIERLHPKAPAESHASECVAELGGNEAFWKYIDKIFEITPSNNGLDLNRLAELALEVGIGRQAFEDCQASGRHRARIEADIEDGINSGLRGTPYSVFITRSGKKFPVSGAINFTTLESVYLEARASL